MTIREVAAAATPNEGRLIWNANDQTLAARLDSLALNVRQAPYGARGDGLADDRPAIQAAIDACSAAGGGHVFLPAGVYRVDGPLLLRDGVNLLGAGMNVATIRLGDGSRGPVLTDSAAGRAGAYAFGRVHLADFAIDGNREHCPEGGEGLFTTAYYSFFERLYIHDCQGHGLRIGFSGMANRASQDSVTGCRISDCGGAGVLLDINGIDHVVAQCYIHDCEYGVEIHNGGVRVVNNDLYGNHRAAILITQTAYSVIVAANDLNANRQHGIIVTRTTQADSGPWGQLLISGNAILGDRLEQDNAFDGIFVESDVPAGISKLTIVANKVFTLGGPIRFRYGVHLARHVTKTMCSANHIHNAAAGMYAVGPTCSAVEIDSLGGGVLEAPPLPESDAVLVNPFHAPVMVYLSGGVVSDVAIAGRSTRLPGGSFRLAAGQTISVTYTAPPSWTWIAD